MKAINNFIIRFHANHLVTSWYTAGKQVLVQVWRGARLGRSACRISCEGKRFAAQNTTGHDTKNIKKKLRPWFLQ
jgi:hypothetical protein